MRILITLFFIISTLFATAQQDVATYLKDAENFDKQLKEKEAKSKYETVLQTDATNIAALLRLTELTCAEGSRIADKKLRKPFYTEALQYAQKMVDTYPENDNANYAIAFVYMMMMDVDNDSKSMINDVKLSHGYATKALSINSNHANANYVLGKWHYDLLNVTWYKKVVMKALYGKVPVADIDTAITHLEKARSIQPYFVADYYTLAKAYQLKNRPSKTIEVLTVLVKLPNRTADDIAIKAEAKKMLEGEE